MDTNAEWPTASLNISKVITCVLATMCIVYGSYRSLKLEEWRSQDKRSDRSGNRNDAEDHQNSSVGSGAAYLSTNQALLIPLTSSLCLLIIFFFFESVQLLVILCTAVLATIAFAFLLHPVCQCFAEPCLSPNKMSFGPFGRFTPAEVVSGLCSLSIVMVWVITGHWLLMDVLGLALCVAFIAYVRLPSLKVSTLLLVGLLIYDVFWVFFSSRFFHTNVMINVATKEAQNPISSMAKRLNFDSFWKKRPKLSLPGKIVFPGFHSSSSETAGRHHVDHFSLLGLGDIVMPGLLLCFVLRYDHWHHRQQLLLSGGDPAAADSVRSGGGGSGGGSGAGNAKGEAGGCGQTPELTISVHRRRISYFHCALIGYFLGLMTATVSSEVFRSAQPALLYLVPFTLLPLLVMAYLKGELTRMWSRPFLSLNNQRLNV